MCILCALAYTVSNLSLSLSLSLYLYLSINLKNAL